LANDFKDKDQNSRISSKAYYLQFLDPARAKTKIVDLLTLGNVPGTTTEKPKDVIDWIRTEMETEDVEVSYKIDSKTGHIVALTQFYYQDGTPWVRYRDDSNQNHAGGDTKEKEARIGFVDYLRLFTFNNLDMQYIVSESVVPEP